MRCAALSAFGRHTVRWALIAPRLNALIAPRLNARCDCLSAARAGPENNVYDELPSLEDVKEDPSVVQGVLDKWKITQNLKGFAAAWAGVEGSKPMEEHFADTGYSA